MAFAHRGARAHAPENTLEAFQLALRLGAQALESDVWLTSDGVAVLDHDGVVGPPLRRRAISSLTHARLPGHIPTLADLYADCGTDFHLSLDVKDPLAAGAVLDVASQAGNDAVTRLWLCHDDFDLLKHWRHQNPDVCLVDSTRVKRMRKGPEREAATAAQAGINAVNLHHSDWSGGLTTLFHRFGLLCFAWDAQYERVLDAMFDMGIDGVYSDHVDRLVAALDQAYPCPPAAAD